MTQEALIGETHVWLREGWGPEKLEGFQIVKYTQNDGITLWRAGQDELRSFVYDFSKGSWVEYFAGSIFTDDQSVKYLYE